MRAMLTGTQDHQAVLFGPRTARGGPPPTRSWSPPGAWPTSSWTQPRPVGSRRPSLGRYNRMQTFDQALVKLIETDRVSYEETLKVTATRRTFA